MGKHFNTAVRKNFANRMAELSEFREEKAPKSVGYPGERSYKMNKENISLWISLITSPKGYNSFVIECGFSRMMKYPDPSMRPSIFDLTPKNFVDEDEGFFRLRTKDEECDYSWSLGDEFSLSDADLNMQIDDIPKDKAVDIVQPLVDSAFETLLARGIPILVSIT